MDTKRKIREITDDLKRFSSNDPVSTLYRRICKNPSKKLEHFFYINCPLPKLLKLFHYA